MAILNAYSIFDQAAAAYQRPFFTTADGLATRAFTDIATDANHDVGKHPEHYSIWRIGTFSEEKGTFHPEDKHCLMTGTEAVSLSRQIKPGSLVDFDAEVSAGGTV